MCIFTASMLNVIVIKHSSNSYVPIFFDNLNGKVYRSDVKVGLSILPMWEFLYWQFLEVLLYINIWTSFGIYFTAMNKCMLMIPAFVNYNNLRVLWSLVPYVQCQIHFFLIINLLNKQFRTSFLKWQSAPNPEKF